MHPSSLKGISNSRTVHARPLVGSYGNSPVTFCGRSTLTSCHFCHTLSCLRASNAPLRATGSRLRRRLGLAAGCSAVGSGNGLARGGGGCTSAARNRSSSLTFSAITFAIGGPLRTAAATLPALATLQFNGVPGPHHCTPLAISTNAPLSVSFFVTDGIGTSCRSLGWGPCTYPSTAIFNNPATSPGATAGARIATYRRLSTTPGSQNTFRATRLTAGEGQGAMGYDRRVVVRNRCPTTAWWQHCTIGTVPTMHRETAGNP